MTNTTNVHRRRLLGAAATVIATAPFGHANAQPPTDGAFTPRQIDAGVLNVGYVEMGPADGPAVLLLHGWPYDIHSYAEVAPMLASVGYRVVVPYLRGYGTTRFLSGATPRNGQQAALAADVVALMDALAISSAILAGYDWGARTADIVAALWPERCKGLVSVSGYLIGSPAANKAPLPPKAELAGGTNFTSRPSAVRPAMTATGGSSPNSSGRSLHRSGSSTTQRSAGALKRSTIRIMSPSWSITIAGGSASRTVSAGSTLWRRGLPPHLSSTSPRSRWRVTRTAPRTPSPPPTPSSSPANTCIGP